MAAEQLIDKEIQFRKRARRRLVGAVALVLLMVTVLPMVLDDRGQKTPQPEISISIPNQDGTDFSSKIVPVVPKQSESQNPPVQMTSPVEKPKETVTPVEPKASAVASKAKPSSVVKPAEQAPADTKPTSPTARIAPDTVAETKIERASPTEANSSLPATVTAKKGTVSVQIGVFSDAAKVKQLQAKIADGGIQCYTENLNTPKGVKIRLRCGPFAGKPEAQQALEHLKTAGYSGILVTNQ